MRKKLNDDNVYFLYLLNNKVIINSEYKGLNILDLNLNKIKHLEVYEGFGIETYTQINDKLLLFYDDEHQKIIYFNVNDYNIKITDLTKYKSNENIEGKDIILFEFYYKDNIVFRNKDYDYIYLDLRKEMFFSTTSAEKIKIEEYKKYLKNKKIKNQNKKTIDKLNELLKIDDDYVDMIIEKNLLILIYETKIIMYDSKNNCFKEIYNDDSNSMVKRGVLIQTETEKKLVALIFHYDLYDNFLYEIKL